MAGAQHDITTKSPRWHKHQRGLDGQHTVHPWLKGYVSDHGRERKQRTYPGVVAVHYWSFQHPLSLSLAQVTGAECFAQTIEARPAPRHVVHHPRRTMSDRQTPPGSSSWAPSTTDLVVLLVLLQDTWMEDVTNMYMSIQDAKHQNAEPE